jgi:hypothetical protein
MKLITLAALLASGQTAQTTCPLLTHFQAKH